MTAEKTKYGIPVSGRVDVLLHKKLRDTADKYGLTMSKMVDTALSEWAQTSEIRQEDKQLRSKINQLEAQAKKSNKDWKKWRDTAKSLNDDLTRKLKQIQSQLETANKANSSLKSQLNKMESYYTQQLETWQQSVVLFIDTIAEYDENYKQQLTKEFKQIFKNV